MNKFGVAALLLFCGFMLGFGVRSLITLNDNAQLGNVFDSDETSANDSEGALKQIPPQLNYHESNQQESNHQESNRQALNLHQAKVLIAQLKRKLNESAYQTEKIVNLQRKIKTLEQQLNEQSVKQDHQFSPEQDVQADNIEQDALSAQEVSQYLPEPFDRFYDVANVSLVKRVNQFVSEAIEPDFAQSTSLQIADFISLHQYGYGIEVKSINCKASSCLLTMVELEDNSWQRIYNDMQLQPWWMFKHSHLSSQGSNDKALLLQLLSTQ